MALKGSQQNVERREHALANEARRVQLVDAFGGVVTDGNYTMKIDDTDANTTYIGKAQIGTATSADEWQIQRIETSGNVQSFEWAGGTDEFNQVWDNRAGLSYS